jgi:hypothetical protein
MSLQKVRACLRIISLFARTMEWSGSSGSGSFSIRFPERWFLPPEPENDPAQSCKSSIKVVQKRP